MFYSLKQSIRSIIPWPLLSAYHFLLAFLASLFFLSPSKRLIVIGVTGTKGKSSTTEYISAIFEAAGFKTAVLNSIRIKIGEKSRPNRMRMSMPGRFGMQKFLADAADGGAKVAIIEMTSEGARLHRHRFIDLDCLVFTNLSPEHIESHGSFEAYAEAKLSLGQGLAKSSKRPRIMVANADDGFSAQFLTLPIEEAIPFSLVEAEPYAADSRGGHFRFGETDVAVKLPGLFSLQNALAAAVVARAFKINDAIIASGIARVTEIPGRAQEIREGQDFTVVVDYAHTPDSLHAIYEAYAPKRLICVLGGTGGGRDLWKRPEMGKVADEMCTEVILTNEDPYDEAPQSITDMIAGGMKRKPRVELDRRTAIGQALALANAGDAVIITGKGTDPTIQGPRGMSIPWSDALITREELKSLAEARKQGLPTKEL